MRTRACGVWRYQKNVELRITFGATPWWHGVVCCRARVCPVCWLARRFAAAREVEWTVTERENATHCQSVLATMTVRHKAGDPVTLARGVRAVWRRFIQSRAWRVFKAEYGCEWIIAEEVTRGDNGWHPHLHALLLPSVPIPLDDMYALSGAWFHWWCRHVRRELGEARVPLPAHGCDLSPCDSARYLTKLGLELADPRAVKGRAPLALLEQGEIDPYMELQCARTRARDITYSRGLHTIREAMPEGADFALLAEVPGIDWGLLRHRGWAIPLEIAERSTTPETAAAVIRRALDGSPLDAVAALWQPAKSEAINHGQETKETEVPEAAE